MSSESVESLMRYKPRWSRAVYERPPTIYEEVPPPVGRLPWRRAIDMHVELSPRRFQVAQLLARGFTNKEIGAYIGITTKTADNHRTSVFQQTGCRNAVDLARYALARGWIKNEFTP